MSFSDKVVIVTGASSGIGAAAAAAFAKEGADVIIVGRNEPRLKKVAADISTVGKPPLVIKADLTKNEDLKTVVTKTIDKYSKLDILVNNAGCFKIGKILDENLAETYDFVMNTNLRSAVVLTNLAAPHLIKTKGNIVNISSICGEYLLANLGEGYGPYCVSKAGLNLFTRAAAFELAPHGVRVNSVNPGPVATAILDSVEADFNWETLETMTPLKVLPKLEEVASLIMYLAGDKAVSITGSHFKIDSGMTLK